MLTSSRSLKIAYTSGRFRNFTKIGKKSENIIISEEIRHGLENSLPIVALESTIVTHGMPYPRNIECALEVEKTIRKKGVIPATIAIINGKMRAGLTKNEITQLGDVKFSSPVKTSRRDLAYVISNKLNGGTTVSGTLIISNAAGIAIFATGGLGGVHREAEKTFDISADLVELGKTPIAVFSSGIKSILDIPKTLEYLETQGVFVATFGDTKDFPGFYTSKSGFQVPYNVTNAKQAADIIKSNKDMDLGSGMLFGVPVPEEFSMNKDVLDGIIKEALDRAESRGVIGKEMTPFLLSCVADATRGRSLDTNIALVKNNASVAADVALELSRTVTAMRDKDESSGFGPSATPAQDNEGGPKKRPVVIGGCVLDRCISLYESDIKHWLRSRDITIDTYQHWQPLLLTGLPNWGFFSNTLKTIKIRLP
ncbi:hypothetical protein Trydic_g20176 [Trypoxylus dichotomus]